MEGLINRLTFARPSSLIAEGLVATIPILIALLLQSPPVFFDSYDLKLISAIAGLAIVVGNTTVFWLLSKSAKSTYSPSLHQLRFRAESTLVFFLLSTVLVFIGYIIMVYPSNGRILPSLSDIIAGIIIIQAYAVLLTSAHSSAIISKEERHEKERLIKDFLSETETLSQSSSSAMTADEDEIINSGQKIIQKLQKEPMPDSKSLESTLQEWIDAFEQYQTGGRRKMVGGVRDPESMNKPWESLYCQYHELGNELNTLLPSSQWRLRDGNEANS